MERLNNIMGKAALRRQYGEQRSSGGSSPMGSRPPVSQQPPGTRRPLSEQTAQTGQRPLYNSRQNTAHPATQKTRTMPGQEERASERTNTRAYDPAHRRPTYPRQQGTTNSVTPYQARPRPTQEDTFPSIPPSRMGIPGSGYYQSADYRPPVQADVTEEWDDEGGMVYGDWEENDEELIYEREEQEDRRDNRRPTYYAADMPVPNVEDRRTRSYVTRDLREQRMPVITQHVQPVPTQVREEQQRYQRTTQPLNSQALVSLNRERTAQPVAVTHPAPTQLTPLPQKARQTISQEVIPASSTHIALPAGQKSPCPHCKGAGFLRSDVPFGHPNFGKPVPCVCKEAERKERRRQQLRDMSNLDAYRNKNFNEFNSRVPGVAEAYDCSRIYAQNPEGWLLLVGTNGSGKTHLALAIANQCLDSGAVVLFAVVPDLLDHLRAAFAPTSEEVYDQLFSKMREAEVLVLDDLGAQQSSPWANEKLFQLLNYRYNMGMPTVITANPKGLQGIDERIRSRLSDNNLVTYLSFERVRDYRPNHPRRNM